MSKDTTSVSTKPVPSARVKRTIESCRLTAKRTGEAQVFEAAGGIKVTVTAKSDVAELERAFWRSYYGDREPVGPNEAAPPSA